MCFCVCVCVWGCGGEGGGYSIRVEGRIEQKSELTKGPKDQTRERKQS